MKPPGSIKKKTISRAEKGAHNERNVDSISFSLNMAGLQINYGSENLRQTRGFCRNYFTKIFEECPATWDEAFHLSFKFYSMIFSQ